MTRCETPTGRVAGAACPPLKLRQGQTSCPWHPLPYAGSRFSAGPKRRSAWWLALLTATLASTAGLTHAAAQDTVYISSSTGSRGYTKLTGRVLDYTGRVLEMEMAGGLKRSYPAENVVKIETQCSPQQTEADALFARGEFASALALYGQARAADSRTWVRRQITARMVWCHRALGQLHEAGEEFLVLVRSDPDTPYFDCIPLAWVPSQPPVALEQAAREWLHREDLPAAVLLGASHLMPTAMRSAALARLGQLAAEGDPRIAALAVAQAWRAAVATADPGQLDSWQRAIERMPEAIRPGPYYVLGQALAQQGQWEEAALSLLRVPILYGKHRALAARALLDAGRSLEKLDRTAGASRLYRELLESYPDARAAGEARARLEELTQARG